MRISSTTLQRYRLQLRRPLTTARGVIRERCGLIVQLRDEREHLGLGDAAPLPGFSDETLGQVEDALTAIAQPSGPLAGRELDSIEAIEGLLGTLGALARLPAARHAVEQALLDLLAQRSGRPVGSLLGNARPTREWIPAHVLVTNAEQARRAVSDGYRWLKVKVGVETPEHDEERLRQIRAAVGDDVALRADANGSWTSEAAALGALERLAQVRVHSVEQPLPAGDPAALARVRAVSPVPIAADESVRTLDDLERVLAAHAADALVIKPMLCGGLIAASRMADRAHVAGLPISVTTSFESGVGRHGALQVAAAVQGPLWSCGLCTGALLEQDLVEGPSAKGGRIHVPTATPRPLAAAVVPSRASERVLSLSSAGGSSRGQRWRADAAEE
jgi:o-succinylbenzoate synthase